MTNKTRWEIALAVIGIAGFVLAWRAAHMAHLTEAAVADVARRKPGLEERILRVIGQRLALERERAELQSALDQLRATPRKRPSLPYGVVEVVPPALAAAQAAVHKLPWRDLVLQKDPKLQALYLRAEPVRVATHYGSFFQLRGLSADEVEKFKGLMLENDERMLDLKVTAGSMSLQESDPALAQLQQQTADRLRAGQIDLLGEQGYQQLQQYERAMPARDFVTTLAGSLAFAESPLNTRQAEQLVQFMVNGDPAYRDGGKADPPALSDQFDDLMMTGKPAPEFDVEAVLKQARGVLNDTQYIQLETRLRANQSLVRLFNLIQRQPGEPMVGFVFGRR